MQYDRDDCADLYMGFSNAEAGVQNKSMNKVLTISGFMVCNSMFLRDIAVIRRSLWVSLRSAKTIMIKAKRFSDKGNLSLWACRMISMRARRTASMSTAAAATLGSVPACTAAACAAACAAWTICWKTASASGTLTLQRSIQASSTRFFRTVIFPSH